MKLDDFKKKVDAAQDVTGIGSNETGLIIKHDAVDYKVHIPFDTIENNEWEDLYGVIKGERDANALQHVTRIVGYFSKISNWNPGKVSELDDRHRGVYGVK